VGKEGRMTRNVGSTDRAMRALGGLAMLACSATAPFVLAVRLATFAAMGTYLLFTALAGTCFGYTLLGKSTCSSEPGR